LSRPLWPYKTPGIPDELFERIPGIPLSPREVRIQLLAQLRLERNSVLWDIGAGTGTIPVEAGLLCPEAQIVAIERDAEVAELITRNCERFGVKGVVIHQGNAPECLQEISADPDRVCIEGGRVLADILQVVWKRLRVGGRVVIVTSALEGLYRVSEQFSLLQARQVEIVQSGIHCLERRGNQQSFVALDPTFVLSGEKI
jgi:cobalt-precorrin-6B (C15)-methyltransferase